ncbi:DeoR/GlpR family transcriptional regulator of sugar metabolism [Streptomyces sp. SAI-218]
MYAPERQQEILRLARDGGRVDVVSLAEEFQVTAETIRRDLKALDRAGLLRRVHGGAIPAGRLDFEPDLAERETTAADEKDHIAKAALAELPTEGTLILDAGTTVARLAAAVPLEASLTVVTHSLPIAARLADHPGIQLHLVGGRVRHRTRAAVDAWALRAYGEIRADVFFRGGQRLLRRARPHHPRPRRGRGQAGRARRRPPRGAARRLLQARPGALRPLR